jgi:hypothetical protein
MPATPPEMKSNFARRQPNSHNNQSFHRGKGKIKNGLHNPAGKKRTPLVFSMIV